MISSRRVAILVDFSKMLEKGPPKKEIDPLTIFKYLDKRTKFEYLRDPQKAILLDWHLKHRSRKDHVVKLHTGEGKTLVSLLMLQSYMNEGLGPAVYICPDNYLVSQTIAQAKNFQINLVEAGQGPLPLDFLNSKAILVTNCQKLFNGQSVFGVMGSSREPVELGAIAMDDAHKCIDIISEQFSIKVWRKNKTKVESLLYKKLFALFKENLKSQGPGTLRDLESGEDRVMAVPFWAWHEKQNEVLDILEQHKGDAELTFVWNLIKDRLSQSTCVFSGTQLQIIPRMLPVEMIPSFHKAKRRVFLSATLMEDAFLVRDLGVDPQSVKNPLEWSEATYSGERMILMPALVEPTLQREQVIAWLSELVSVKGDFGVVALVPSGRISNSWENAGCIMTSKDNIEAEIAGLKIHVENKSAKKVIVLVNRYDGIDLPDEACRILCLDSLPDYDSIIDDYNKQARPNSTLMRRRLAQRIEQGIGRGIRGVNDWCIVIIIGNALTDFLSEDAKRKFLSKEAQAQIAIAENLARQMKEEGGVLKVLAGIVDQCLKRDENWKAFYRQSMQQIEKELPNKEYLDRAVKEREAESLACQGHHKAAAQMIQDLMAESDPGDRGWYLQLMATYLYPLDRSESLEKQLKAYAENNSLFKPDTGVTYTKMHDAGSTRESLILQWINERQNHNTMIVHLNSILEKIVHGVRSGLFEEGVQEMGMALGFGSQRPEKELKAGPDNLWHIKGKSYWIISCKNNVAAGRTDVSKGEIGQLLTDIAWFNSTYDGADGKPIIIHPASKFASDANSDEPIWAITDASMAKLKRNILYFYNSFQAISHDRITTELIKAKLKEHQLEVEDLNGYLTRVTRT